VGREPQGQPQHIKQLLLETESKPEAEAGFSSSGLLTRAGTSKTRAMTTRGWSTTICIPVEKRAAVLTLLAGVEQRTKGRKTPGM
jgi:hypothetical protein